MSEWKETTLFDISSDISYGYTESAHIEKIGPKFLRITDIANNQLNWSNVPYCSINDENFKKYRLFPGDIVIARTGATTGSNYTIKKSDPTDVVYASYLIRYKINREIADPFFIGQILQSASWQDFVNAIAGGSAQPGANASQLASFPILLPSLPEQRAITAVLSSLDDKIDLLRRQNQTLEAMAETLFRQWFVEEADEGWEIKPLGSVVTVKRGGSPRPIQDYLSETGFLWLKISDATKENSPFIFEIKEHIKIEGLKKTTLLEKETLVLSNSATPGIPKILQVDSCIHDGWLHFPRSYFSKEFLYLLFKYIREELISQGNGSIFINLKTDILKEYKIPIPNKDQLQIFQNSIELYFNKILNNSIEIRTLESLRDTLLPKLMSGEVRVQV